MEPKVLSINTDCSKRPGAQETLLKSRMEFARTRTQEDTAEITIVVVACNRIRKTQNCIRSILENTSGLDYSLILIDSGSEDGTLEYFKGVPYAKKKIIHISQNLGGMFPFLYLNMADVGDYLVFVANDIVVTPNWLNNLLICAKSDPDIGMVAPMASNASNLQGISIPFSSYEDMQRKAAAYNRSDPRKWQERLRLITLSPLFKKEALLAIGFPLFDPAFYHDFGDDDLSFRIRRMGYKAVLAGDCWIHHDHDFTKGEDKDPKEFKKSLEMGKKDFREKYYGVDAWDDVNNYYIQTLSCLPAPSSAGIPKILGIDVKCGTPALDVKNYLRSFGIFKSELHAFTQEAKYVPDLQTICRGQVVCDREEFIRDYFGEAVFDYIIIDKPINTYHEPQKLIDDAFRLLRKGGIVILKLLNTYSVREYLNILGQHNVYNPQFAYNIPPEVFRDTVCKKGRLMAFLKNLEPDADNKKPAIKEFLKTNVEARELDACLDRLLARDFIYAVQK